MCCKKTAIKREDLEKKIDGWKTLWVTNMPLFHCGSGSSIYIGTAVALLQCCLTLCSEGKGKESAGIHIHTHDTTDSDNGARFSHVTGNYVQWVDDCSIVCLSFASRVNNSEKCGLCKKTENADDDFFVLVSSQYLVKCLKDIGCV